eukprot:NODE_244_length_13037_cov_0.560442.p8 type:complete len:172 gc:universal NODE_244_length_13037_cov_0.560442:10116-9601(-)
MNLMRLVYRKINGYNLFVRETAKEIGQEDFLKKVAGLWKNLSSEEKEEFNQKAKLEPEKVKKTPSAYNLFVKDNYKSLGNKEDPLDLSKLSQKWNTLSESEKSAYKPATHNSSLESPSSPKNSKKPSAYNNFIKANFGKTHADGEKASSTLKTLAEQYRSLSNTEKESYKK